VSRSDWCCTCRVHRHAEVIGQFGLSKVAGAHVLGGHKSFHCCGGGAAICVDILLDVIFTADEEGELLVVIEVRSRNLDRAANVSAGVDVSILGLGVAIVLAEPVLGIQLVGSAIDIEAAVKIGAARLADRVMTIGPLALSAPKFRRLDLDLLHIVHVDDLIGARAIAGIGDVHSIADNRDAFGRSAVGLVVARLSSNDAGVGCEVIGARSLGHLGKSRKRFDEFGHVAPSTGRWLMSSAVMRTLRSPVVEERRLTRW